MTVHVGFVLIPGFPMLSFASVIESLRAANVLSGKQLYRWSLISIDGHTVEASNNLRFAPDYSAGTDRHFDYLFVCAGGNPALFKHEPTFKWLKWLARQNTKIGGLSGGAYILARAGLLFGYRFTLHWEHAPAFAEDYPDLDLRRSLFEIDRDRLTSSGGSASLDMMHALIAQQNGPELAIAVSDWFLQTQIREGEGPQRMELRERLGITSAPLLRAVSRMEQNTERPLSRKELSKIAQVSVRHLDRLFHRYLRHSVGEHYIQIRLHTARELLRQTNLSIMEVAMASGFVSSSHFSRVYKEKYGHTPSSERVQSRL
ncbi:GlxA family transcriptional regulator [Mesorhizobium sp. 113-3-3]|uniref:GlxA family transcriptional regulator n=1 Tax=Mesorhizobium sp. 113-3-3 TaxID=2744516 RepID=UPI0018ECC16F|nr:GlxA family transcriptional regulator [Mesorhizobium sp. 113-3-3]BCG83261.1 AraC family transcriptional regulator [Mesorhizobium sp. 113-3-3]